MIKNQKGEIFLVILSLPPLIMGSYVVVVRMYPSTGPSSMLSCVELYTESVFFGQNRSVFLGIYRYRTKGKLGQYFRYHNFGGNPFFPQNGGPFSSKGGQRPLFFDWTTPLFRKLGVPAKRLIPTEISNFPEI